ncbi:MAG: ABC transporter permease [Lachnospiraceae bacterium]|nr:ABC transporter permease [Lachnospiraceae bacterium]
MNDEQKKHKKLVIAAVWAVLASIGAVVLLHHNPLDDQDTENLKKLCGIILLGTGAVVFTFAYDKLTVLPKELWQSRRLIWRLAKNDFRKRYAGSIFGAVWALVQPVITVIMYYIVFDRIFHQHLVASGQEIPYVLFLTTGLVPWFFFTDALSSGTASLLEYNYLVKKVVFKVSILPIIKIIAAFFTHVFFTAVMLLIALLYGFRPSLYWLQLLYYSAAEFIFVLGLCYTTCAVTVYFRDLQQIIGIILQVGMWATPILWDINVVSDKTKAIIKINPMTYIVNGFRTSIYGKQWFFEHFYSSTYFWITTVLVFIIGSLVFKKLKVSFADVL